MPKISCNELKTAFYKNAATLPYANPVYDSDGKPERYGGWVSDFHITNKGKTKSMKLDLNAESDNEREVNIFLLFVLAVAWSRTGQWENSAMFVSYLRLIDDIKTKAELQNWVEEIRDRNHEELANEYTENMNQELELASAYRDTPSVRCDIFKSITVLYDNWNDLYQALNAPHEDPEKHYTDFAVKLRSIKGLGVNGKKMRIKIPLILRELRISGKYPDIPGKYCCVADERVYETVKYAVDFDLKKINGSTDEALVRSLFRVSKQIYDEFGDWYDLPLFAYDDLPGFQKLEDLKNQSNKAK